MKSLFRVIVNLLLVVLLFQGCDSDKRVVLAYVYSGQEQEIDPFSVTHINYAFGQINEDSNGIIIENESFFIKVALLKQINPNLKILLSIGGAGEEISCSFVDMVMDDDRRLAFAKDCKRILNQYNIDGIDLDWETPYLPEEILGFTTLVSDIRNEIGMDKILTFAAPAHCFIYDFEGLVENIDFINIMGYDIAWPPLHQAALYRSDKTGRVSIDEAVHQFIQYGVPANKIVLGFPCYGLGADTEDAPRWVNYRDMHILKNLEECWDPVACASYYSDKNGNLVLSFESPKSLSIKCQYVKDMNLRGMMYWTYGEDDDQGTLRYTVYNGLK